jgi:hypothetical protein
MFSVLSLKVVKSRIQDFEKKTSLVVMPLFKNSFFADIVLKPCYLSLRAFVLR